MTSTLNRRDLLVRGSATLFTLSMASSVAARSSAPASAAGTVALAPDMKVNRMGFGAMRITGAQEWGQPPDPAAIKRLLRRAVDLGVNFIDTADAYGPNVSEELIADALYPYPKDLIIGTKGGIVRPSPPEWVADSSPKHLREACEASLNRLRLERIDLYQLHAVDDDVPLADSVGELARLQKEGKIRYIGVSNVTVDELQQARSLVKVVAVQNRYNVAARRSEEVLKICERDGIVFIPHTPLARSALAGQKRDPKIDALEKIAKQRGMTTAQAALAWLLARSPLMLPIPGTSSVAHLEENVAAAAMKLSAQEFAAIG
jgi:pyridoxine 4-dehydrogenase